jgi:hypothetical protein
VTLALAPDESIMDLPTTNAGTGILTGAVAVAEPGDDTADPAVDATDELVERVRPWAVQAVDALQIAAKLESEGVTDRLAFVRHARADVFDLAEEVHRRLTGGPAPSRSVGAAPRRDDAPESPRRRTLRDLSHGLLYLIPSASFPATLALLPGRSLVAVLLLAGAVGWVWSSVASWMAYQFLGARRPGSAARLLRWSTLSALPVAGLVGLAVTTATGGSLDLVALAVAMMAYQMASTLLIVYRAELWLGVIMLPAVSGGVAFLVVGPEVAPWALAVAGASVVAALALALARTVVTTRQAGSHRAVNRPVASTGTVVLVTAYSGLGAVFLLHAQAPYLSTRLDILLAIGPLLAAMGLVEWRVRRYIERGRDLLARVAGMPEFARVMRRRLVLGALGCAAAAGVLAMPVLAGLAAVDLLTGPVLAMAGAATALGGAYFLGFVLASQSRFGTLAAALAVATVAHLAAAALLPASPLADTLTFLGSAVLLGVIELTSLVRTVGQAWRYRISQGDECMP